MTVTMPIAARFTREEYLRLPDASPGFRFELLDGELVTMNDPRPIHQDAALRIASRLLAWCDATPDRGRVSLPIDTELAPDTILGPDVQWYAPGRDLPTTRERPWPVGDLVVEIASPSTARYDAETKLPRYLAAGAREVWLVTVDPLGARVATPSGTPRDGVRELGAGGTLTSPLLPSFALPLSALLG